MTSSRLVRIRYHRRPIGRACLHCGRPAQWTAERVTRYAGGSRPYRLHVRYCEHHAAEAGCTL